MLIIAFAAPAGSGKSLCAQHLVDHFGFWRRSFAAPLYDMLEAGGFGRPKTFEQKEAVIPELGFSWRHAAQTLGTEWGRAHLSKDIWAKLAMRKLTDIDGRYVFDDLRFENEAQALRESGGAVIHITGRKLATANPAHASEAGIVMQDGDYILPNAHGTHELFANLMQVLHSIQHS